MRTKETVFREHYTHATELVHKSQGTNSHGEPIGYVHLQHKINNEEVLTSQVIYTLSTDGKEIRIERRTLALGDFLEQQSAVTFPVELLLGLIKNALPGGE